MNHNQMNVAKAVGLGMMMGAGVSMMVGPKKKKPAKTVTKAIKAVGEVLEDVENALGW